MSNLEELKNKLCPNGVEFKKLEEVCSFIYGYTEKARDEGNVRFVRITDISEIGCLNAEGAKYINLTPECEKYLLKRGDLLTARAGATYGKTLYFDEDYPAVYASYLIKLNLDNNLILNRYYWHFAKSSYYWKQADKLAVGGAQPNLNANSLAKIIVPIPPLEVQEEIVRILDPLTKDVNELVDLLKREQELRKKQYSYYLDKFTTIENSDIVKLKDVAIYRKERLKREFLTEDNYISVENLLKDRAGKIKSSNLPSVDSVIKYEKEDILIGNIRPYLKKIWFSDCIGGTNGDVLAISVTNKEKVYPKYLYYILSSDTFFSYDVKHSQCGKMPRGRKDMILEFTFKLPPLDTQKRIVDILDNLERYTNDLQKGLPAEIEKRKKQYAYYRDELLKFERK